MADFSLTKDGAILFPNAKIYYDTGTNLAAFGERDDVFFMHKRLAYIRVYQQILGLHPANFFQNILEVGVFRGGGAIFLHQLFEPAMLACVDVTKDPIPTLDRYMREQNSQSIHLHLGLNQADRDGLQRVIASDLQSTVDLVVDDASHFYAETRATFEAVFPQLRNGGIYVIEDWGWAHGKRPEGKPAYAPAKKSPLPLITELLILHASEPNAIEDIHIPFHGMMYLVRGRAPLAPSFRLPRAEGASGGLRRLAWPWRKRR